MKEERLLTRLEAIELVKASYGVPITESSFHNGLRKLCPDAKSPCYRRAPEPVARYGPTTLYRPADIHAWAKRLINPEEG
jgi:hypothetical protein